ncbi:hypothetical protein V501_01798 [Pseudogymnoascus sp. VKM F-4519 (FW-2642)]|nr:hypothetical protein V501_01798 [Pseudogymnoascus sp. VKM F-4519 (FW-2642)]
MLANFLELPSELRNQIYELCLLHKEPLALWTGFNQRHELSTSLLRTNKTLHHEASSILYAYNRFDFTIATPERIALFLQTIGRVNAGYIQHVSVDFPIFYHGELSGVTLLDDSISIFASIQGSCVNLSTLTAFMGSALTMEFELDEQGNPETIPRVLKLVDTLFRATSPLLKTIIVGVYNNCPRNFITEMESCGWIIKATNIQFSLAPATELELILCP